MNKPQNGVQIKEIAQSLGLSAGTVSFVLNGKGDRMRISKATQQRVLDKAKELHYQPNIYARRLRRSAEYSPRHVIAFLIEERFYSVLIGPFFQGVFSYLESLDEAIDVNLYRFRYDHLEDLFSVLDPNRFSGAVIGGASRLDEEALANASVGIPFVLFNSDNPRFSCAYLDGDEVGRKCAHLFAARGHCRPAIITSKPIDHLDQLRTDAFIAGCAECSIPVSRESVIIREKRDASDGLEAMHSLLSLSQIPDCVFVIRSNMVFGVLDACRERGIRIPQDLELVAYGESALLSHSTPSVTTIHGLIDDTSRYALELLIRKINSSDAQETHGKMHPIFEFRESCGGFPKGDEL